MFIGRPPFIEQLNDISFWYPILGRIRMRTPDTQLFYVDHEAGRIVDGQQTESFKRLVADIERARDDFGGEAFLRTGQTSNKHDWSRTCHLDKDSDVTSHVAELINFSMMVDLPYTTFAVRRMIATAPITTAFRDMPITREVRMFVQGGKLVCAHPYWPDEAFKDDPSVTPDLLVSLQVMPKMTELTQMAQYVSRAFEGAWSVDFLEDAEGNWWLTDMAIASSSYHWPGCENEEAFPEEALLSSPTPTRAQT